MDSRMVDVRVAKLSLYNNNLQQYWQNIYLLMKPIEKKKYDIMSECLKSFNQLPHNLECYGRIHNPVSSNDVTLEIIDCVNKFTELATISQEYIQSQIPLFHRFFCRIRDIIFSFLTYYLHMNHFIYIRELLMEINKILLQYRPATGHHTVLLGISSAIKNSITNMIHSQNHNKQQVSALMQKFVTFEPKIKIKLQEPQAKTYVRKPMQNALNALNQSIKSKQSTQASLSKLFCLQKIDDIDYGQMEKYNTSNSEELFNDCLNRNRFICQLMKKYEAKYKSYENRPEHKKNRQGAQFRPTTFKEPSTSRSIKKRSIGTSNSKRFSPLKQKLNISDSVTLFGTTLSPEDSSYNQTILKQQILNHLYAYRQKCCLRKVVIGGQQIQTETNPRQTLRQYQRRNNKSTLNAKTQRAKSYSHRFQVLKNNKSYISGVVSIPIKNLGA